MVVFNVLVVDLLRPVHLIVSLAIIQLQTLLQHSQRYLVLQVQLAVLWCIVPAQESATIALDAMLFRRRSVVRGHCRLVVVQISRCGHRQTQQEQRRQELQAQHFYGRGGFIVKVYLSKQLPQVKRLYKIIT
uniref:Uncharacterized protein n=1 Tax=Cacopsylla melanoneura TaxID=428564 RepID=A0A8D8XLA8_9HEMI